MTVDGTATSQRRPSELAEDSWSNFTGQIWDQFMSYGYDKLQAQQQQQQSLNPNQSQSNLKTFAELFEELYERMPMDIGKTNFLQAMQKLHWDMKRGQKVYGKLAKLGKPRIWMNLTFHTLFECELAC